MGTHAHAPINFRNVQVAGTPSRGVVPHLLERPDEIDRRRARFGQDTVCGVEVLPALGSQDIAVRSGDPDRRSPAHGERPDRLRDLGRRRAPEVDGLVRKPALIQQDDSAGFQTDDPLGA